MADSLRQGERCKKCGVVPQGQYVGTGVCGRCTTTTGGTKFVPSDVKDGLKAAASARPPMPESVHDQMMYVYEHARRVQGPKLFGKYDGTSYEVYKFEDTEQFVYVVEGWEHDRGYTAVITQTLDTDKPGDVFDVHLDAAPEPRNRSHDYDYDVNMKWQFDSTPGQPASYGRLIDDHGGAMYEFTSEIGGRLASKIPMTDEDEEARFRNMMMDEWEVQGDG